MSAEIIPFPPPRRSASEVEREVGIRLLAELLSQAKPIPGTKRKRMEYPTARRSRSTAEASAPLTALPRLGGSA